MLSIKKLLAKLLSFCATRDSVPVTITSSVGKLQERQAIRTGNVIQLTLRMAHSGSTASGSSAYEGQIVEKEFWPVALVTSGHYYGARAMVGSIGVGGKIIVRNVGSAITNMDSCYMSFTYIVK